MMLMAKKIFKYPFSYTVGMHLGSRPQGLAMLDGYNQKVEDQLLEDVDWESDGYRLFDISCLAGSSKDGFLNPIAESNCFALPKKKLLQLGGFDEGFRTPGGGIVNLDLFERAMQLPEITPVKFLGEASFHQFHGGVATNIPPEKHPWSDYMHEYRVLRGKEFSFSGVTRSSFCFGFVHDKSRRFLDLSNSD
jgi:predicted glycosyltransferase involved in capsule biosynthesis